MKILKFGAVWCPDCLIMKPLWKQIEEENPWLITHYYDFDHDKPEVKQWRINLKLPTFIFLDENSNEILRLYGNVSKNDLLRIINENKNR